MARFITIRDGESCVRTRSSSVLPACPPLSTSYSICSPQKFQLKTKYGDAFIRGNNGACVSCVSVRVCVRASVLVLFNSGSALSLTAIYSLKLCTPATPHPTHTHAFRAQNHLCALPGRSSATFTLGCPLGHDAYGVGCAPPPFIHFILWSATPVA